MISLQPLQGQHLLSSKIRLSKRKKILFLHLHWCLHNASSNPETTDWWSIFNPTNKWFVIVFRDQATQLLQQSTQLTKIQIHKTLSLFPGNSMQWRPLLPKGGGLIQMDIGGHPPIPTNSSCQFLVQHVLMYLFVSVCSTVPRLS